jgi:TolB-like protein
VLPFLHLSGDPQQEYFSDGITNQLINDLSRLPNLFVSRAIRASPTKARRLRSRK